MKHRSALHPEPGAAGPPPGADEPVALIGHLQVATKTGAASATPNYRFERLTNMKPPALPGDIYFSVFRVLGEGFPDIDWLLYIRHVY